MFSFDALCGFPAVISFQMAGHCVLSMTVVYWTRTFDIFLVSNAQGKAFQTTDEIVL